MEVKDKKSQPEVSDIPYDWQLLSLGELFKFKNGLNKSKKYFGIGTPIVNYMDVYQRNGLFAADIKGKVNVTSQEKLNYSAINGDVFFTRTSETVEEVGITTTILDDITDTVFSGFILRARPKNQLLEQNFKRYCFSTKFVREQITSTSSYTTRALINGRTLSIVKLFVPPSREQQAIAEVLSDTDNLIHALEKKIAKKRLIKQGVMQELLTPNDDWIEKSIYQLAENSKDLFDDGDWIESEYIIDQGIRLVQTGNIGVGSFIEKENKKYISKESFQKLGCKELFVGDILICRLADPAGRACVFPFIGEEKVITSVDVTIYRPSINIVNRQFLNQLFMTQKWLNTVSDLCGGTTHKRISRSSLGSIKIKVPNLQEQNRIAQILMDMDDEIIIAKNKLSKIKSLKIALMQQLLTGKIRLIKRHEEVF